MVVGRDAETLGHGCAGPGAQMRAAASTRSIILLPEAEQDALRRVQEFAEALHEDLVVWDLATHRGRRAAKRRGVRETPRVVFRSAGPESVEAFQAQVAAFLRRARARAS